MSVNVPMNKAQKDKDVNQKLQLYGMLFSIQMSFIVRNDGKLTTAM